MGSLLELLCVVMLPMIAAAAEPCAALADLRLPDTAITLAKPVAAGQIQAASRPGEAPTAKSPAVCQVKAVIRPAADSEIKIEIWMPAVAWNGKFIGVGNGGWAGQINTSGMVEPLAQGYATASTDTGHEGGSGASFAQGHPEKLIDYSYRAVHEMTIKAKAIIAAYYGKAVRFSYWIGCSLGGQQGLKEAQLYPADYDGIVAGAPTYNRTGLHAWQLHVGHTALKDDKASYIPPSKLGIIHTAVLAACDALDGVKDGILNDPRQCRFDPAVMLCGGGDSADCLTRPQVEMVRTMYAPAVDPRTGNVLFPGTAPGTEFAWGALIAGQQPFALAIHLFGDLVHQDRNWDWRTFDLGRDTASADAQYKGTLNAEDPDLRAFRARGGKLLMWHGWCDSAVPPQSAIDYYDRVVKVVGAWDFIRLFMVPGMLHCRGGPGPNQFNAIAALERWVEAGMAPDRIVASHVTENRVDMTRPLCPYPQVAQWRGVGSTNDADNFVCQTPASAPPRPK